MEIAKDVADASQNGVVAAGTPVAGARRGGPPLGNRNADKHGLRKTIGWPNGTKREHDRVAAYGNALREAVTESGGVLGIVECGLVQTATRWERHAQLSARWLRLEHDRLSPADRVMFSREHARASSERDKAVAALGLKPAAIAAADPWASVDAMLAAPAPNATEGEA